MQEVAMNLDELHVQPHIVFLVGYPDRVLDMCLLFPHEMQSFQS